MSAKRTIFSVMNSLFAKTLLAQALVWLVMRTFETWHSLSNNIPYQALILHETLGWLFDISIVAIGFFFLFPFLSILRFPENVNSIIVGVLVSLLALLHIPILAYFLYQFEPLDSGLFHYSTDEILYTVRAENTPVSPYVLLAISSLGLVFFSFWVIEKKAHNIKSIGVRIALVLSAIFILLAFFLDSLPQAKFTANKSLLFYQSIFSTNEVSGDIDAKPITTFQKSFQNRKFISREYPLLHTLNRDHTLKGYFDSLPAQPNIVVLIIEGLSYDFLNNFNGLRLLPYLSSLEKESLSWSRCFSLGERSFAVVPSILGGLPYGKKGFTLLPSLPYHNSLISILKPQGYHTAFFYGQGAWFHRKRRFFEYNYCHEIIDNSVFDAQYNKIRVGDDNFFWGYHDKDLFAQAIDFLDSIPPKRPKFHVYFTGTSHSPFVIDSVDKYDEWFEQAVSSTTQEQQLFLTQYKKQLQSLKFADDAIASFIGSYKKRTDFNNTIFIITGDHAMSEIPSQNELKKYHVPLIMYSPLLKTQQQFTTPTSHLDLYESLLSITYSKDLEFLSSSIGRTLPAKNDSLTRWFALMDGSRNINQLVYGNWFYDNGTLYQFDQQVELKEMHNDSVKQSLSNTLQNFRTINAHVCLENTIIDKSNYVQQMHHTLLYSTDTVLSEPIQAEYHNIISKLPLQPQSSTYNIDVDLVFSSEPEPIQLVLNLVDSTGKNLHEEIHGIDLEEGHYQKRFKLKYEENQKLGLLKVFVFNPDKKEYQLDKQSALIHSPKALTTSDTP